MRERRNESEIETELKIKLSIRDMEKVFRALSKMSGASEVSHKFLPRLYYDTADLGLYRKSISLRVQYKPGKSGRLGGYEQTVKFELKERIQSKGKALVRKECKNILKSYKPDLASVADSAARSVVSQFRNKKLVPVFTAAIERRAFDWTLNKGAAKGVVEVAFDAGELILTDSGKRQRFYEIELELKSGGDECIGIVKDQIMRMASSARIQPLSKAEQGVRLYLKHRK